MKKFYLLKTQKKRIPFTILCENVVRNNIDFELFEHIGTLSSNHLNLKDQINRIELHCILSNGINNIRYIDFLLSKGWKINSINKDEETPLHIACQFSSIEIIKYFILHGCDINAKNKYGKTIMHYAVQNINITLDIISFLIDKGCDV